MSRRIVVRGGNIGRKVGPAVARANMRRLLHAGPPLWWTLPSMTLWQEMDDDDQAPEREIADDLLPDRWRTWPHVHRGGALVPITRSEEWELVDAWADKVSDGIPKVTPDRYLSVVVARLNGLDAPLGFISGQAIQGAFTDPGQSHEQDRREFWDQFHGGLLANARQLTKDGVTTVYRVDANNPHMDVMAGENRDLHQGLDYTGHFRGRGRHAVRLDVVSRQRVNGTIDGHDFGVVLYNAT